MHLSFIQSRLPCGWILRCMMKKLIYAEEQFDLPTCKKINLRTHSKKSLKSLKPSGYSAICFFSQSWLECDFCVFDFSHAKPSAGWQTTSTWIGRRKIPEHPCWNSWLCTQRARSALAEQDFIAIMACFKSGWALLLLFLEPNNSKSSCLNESLRIEHLGYGFC